MNDKPPAVTASDGFKSVQLVDGVYQSVKTGNPIVFENGQ